MKDNIIFLNPLGPIGLFRHSHWFADRSFSTQRSTVFKIQMI